MARLRNELHVHVCMLSRILRWLIRLGNTFIFLREDRGVNDAPQIRIIIFLQKNRRSVTSTYKQFICLVSSHAEMSLTWCSLTYNFPEIYYITMVSAFPDIYTGIHIALLHDLAVGFKLVESK